MAARYLREQFRATGHLKQHRSLCTDVHQTIKLTVKLHCGDSVSVFALERKYYQSSLSDGSRQSTWYHTTRWQAGEAGSSLIAAPSETA